MSYRESQPLEGLPTDRDSVVCESLNDANLANDMYVTDEQTNKVRDIFNKPCFILSVEYAREY